MRKSAILLLLSLIIHLKMFFYDTQANAMQCKQE